MHRIPFASLLAACLLASPLYAQPGHGHDHGHAHDHGHDHAGHGPAGVKGPDPRLPLFGSWRLDVEATVDADPELKAAAGRDAKAREQAHGMLDGTAMHFAPDGRAVVRLPGVTREGVYAVTAAGDGFAVRIVDAHDNHLNTVEYAGRLTEGRLHMTQEDTTLIFVRPDALPPRGADAGPPPPFVGRWRVDIERTLAEDPRLRTMTAEQQKAARDAARAFLSKVAFEWRADGTAVIGMSGGPDQENRWRVVGSDGARYTVGVQFVEGGRVAGNETLTLVLDGERLRMTMGPQSLVLVRAQ